MMASMKSRTIVRTIKDPKALGHYVAPRNEEEYDAAVEELDKLMEKVGDNPDDPRQRLIETLTVLIEAYDDEHYPMAEASGVDMLRFLMEQHNLTQSDLPEVGSQGVVSEILHGRRELNVRQIQALAKRFGIDGGAFLSTVKS
jgi:HTH-type transcriptional regulator/antitoxin HigA